MPLTQGDHLMAAKAARQTAGNTGARGVDYDKYDNDANFDARLNSQDAEYFRNVSADDYAEMTVDRWKSGGGIDAGDCDKPGGMGGIHVGRKRDVDGTIDRVKDPPKELLPVLYAIRAQCSSYNIDLHGVFEEAGGTAYGLIATTRFQSALVVALHRMNLDEQTLAALVDAYGCGNQVPTRSAYARLHAFDNVAWKDLCEDVGKAEPDQPYNFPYGGPPPLAR